MMLKQIWKHTQQFNVPKQAPQKTISLGRKPLLKLPFLVMLMIVLGVTFRLAAQTYGLQNAEPINPYLNGVFPAVAPNVSASWTVEVAFTNLTVDQPIFMTPYPGTNRLLVIRKPGQIVMFENRRSVSNSEVQVFLDIQSRAFTVSDSGMTGLAFHPEFGQAGSTNRGYCYVTYKWRPDNNANADYAYWRLSRFTVPDGQVAADPNSELVLVQQLDRQEWHDAGCMFFGQDGFLYFSIGDEGGANDQYNDTQIMNDRLFSGVFRIDVNQNAALSHPIRRQPARHTDTPATWPDPLTTNYFIPNNNPFVDVSGGTLEEFFALGFRQPYRISQDPVTGWIWVGDSGQSTREELDILKAGANYQWAYREGTVAGPKAPPATILGTEKTPIWDYGRDYGGCFIGGYVYRGSEHAPQLTGKYICADNVSGRITAVTYDGTNLISAENIATMPSGSVYGGTSSCGLDANGEIYFLKFGDVGGGQIFKLARTLVAIPDPPALLSQLGVFTNLAMLAPGQGMLPYTVNAPLWSDNAAKKRWLAVPNDGTHNSSAEQIIFSPTNEWRFPVGTVFIKHFDLPVNDANPAIKRRLETRFLVMDQNGGSYGLTYKWRADESDADLLTNGVTANYVITNANSTTRTQTWQFPSRQDCLTCHNANAKYVLGLKTHQLNGSMLYPKTGVTDNQLRALGHIGLFTPPFDEAAIANYPKAQSLTNTAAPLVTRVRSYIDANCSQCHRPGGVRANFDARFNTPIEQQNIIWGTLDSFINGTDDRVVRPGDVLHSLMHNRPNRVGLLQMPPLAKNIVDQQAISVMADWINSLPLGPGVTLTFANTNQAILSGAFTINVTVSESVTGLNSNQFLVVNGQVTSLSGSGQNYTLTIQPQIRGTVTVSMPAGVLIGAGGDGSYASNILSVQYDPLGTSLATWLPLDDASGSVAVDVSGHTNNGTLNNFSSIPWVAGVSGTALMFDGTNNYVGINNVVTPSFTLACWIKTTQVFQQTDPTYGGTGIIWADVGGPANDFILGATRSVGGINRLSFFTGPNNFISGVTPINSGNWTHIAATRDGVTGEMIIYVNGLLDATGTGGTGLLTANPVINIGGNTLDGRYFQGSIDDVRIFSRVLTAPEITTLVAALPPPVAWYKLEANALDSSGNLNHGSPINVSYGASRVDAYAAQFNGTSSYIQIPASISNNFSLAYWVKTTDTGGTGQWTSGKGLVDGDASGAVSDFGTSLLGGKAAFGVGNTNTTITSITSINNGQWHHVVATRNSISGVMAIYVDGNLEATTNGPTGSRTATTALRIGSLQTGGAGAYLAGSIDEVMLFDTTLNAAQIAALAAPNTAPALVSVPNRTIIAGTTLAITNTAVDPDAPPQLLTYSLVGGPAGVTINPTNGILSWRPTMAQSPSTNNVIMKVTDNGVPNLNGIQSFAVTVLRPLRPSFSGPLMTNGTFRLSIGGDLGPDYAVYGSTNLVNWNLLMIANPSMLPFFFTDPSASNFNQRFYRVLLGP